MSSKRIVSAALRAASMADGRRGIAVRLGPAAFAASAALLLGAGAPQKSGAQEISSAQETASAQETSAQETSGQKAAARSLSEAEIGDAVEALAQLLKDNYVFPDVAGQYAERLRENLARGDYAALGDPAALARRLEADVQGVHADAHIRIRPPQAGPPPAPRSQPRSEPRPASPAGAQQPRSILQDTAWLADGVAYTAILGLPLSPGAEQEMQRFIEAYRDAHTLILDLRMCPGGGLNVMDVLFSHIYAERTHLLTMDTRADAAMETSGVFGQLPSMQREPAGAQIVRWTHWAIPAEPTPLMAETEIYVLTGLTASACEHMTLALKRTGRALIVGTATAGAGHYGGLRSFGPGMSVFVPVGRTYDPDTNKGWEGDGVAPDVQTGEADALDYVLAELGVERAAPVLSPAQAAAYVGVYGPRMIAFEGGALQFVRAPDAPAPPPQRPGGPRRVSLGDRALTPLGEDEFALKGVPGGRLVFERGPEGEVAGLTLTTPLGPPMRLPRN